MSDRFGEIDKTAVTAVNSFEEADRQDRAYWHNRTPQVRLAVLEWMRQAVYEYDPATARMDRTLEVIQRG